MLGGIIVIIMGVAMAILGPTVGVIVSKRDASGRRRSARVTGNAAAGIGVCIAIYGIYLTVTAG